MAGQAGITQAQAARMIGVSRNAVWKKVQSGEIRKFADGTLDPADVRLAKDRHDPEHSARARLARPPAPKGLGVPRDDLAARSDPVLVARTERLIEVYREHQRRLTRAYRCGLVPSFVRGDVIDLLAGLVLIDAEDLVRSLIDRVTRGGAFAEDALEGIVAEAVEELRPCLYQWRVNQDGRVLIRGEARWRRARRRPCGDVAVAWDEAQARAARKDRGSAASKRR